MPVHFVVTDMAGIGAVIAAPVNNIAKVFCFIVFPFFIFPSICSLFCML